MPTGIRKQLGTPVDRIIAVDLRTDAVEVSVPSEVWHWSGWFPLGHLVAAGGRDEIIAAAELVYGYDGQPRRRRDP